MKICYFTATGNSLYVARQIGDDDAELLSIPHLMREGTPEVSDDAVGIVAPVYAGDMPKMVHRFLQQAHITTGYLFFVYTFGFSESVARPHAELAAREAGLELAYVNSIKMVDNYLPGFEMDDQKANVGEKKVDEHIAQVRADIAARRRMTAKVGVKAKAAIAAMRPMAKSIVKDSAAQGYIVTDACVRCGICAKVCPADNITVTDHVEFGDHCEVCYACLQNCPHNAIHLKGEKSAARFRNEHVPLKDIIAANA